MSSICKRNHVRVVAVNTTVRDQPEEVKPTISRAGEGSLQYSVAGEFAVRDRLVNSRQILIDDPAGSQIKMANFGVTHLSIRQADVSAARAQFSTWIVAVELVVERRPRKKRCVRIFFALFFTARINAPAIANNEHHRTSHMQALCRRSSRSTSRSLQSLRSAKRGAEMMIKTRASRHESFRSYGI